MDFNKKQMKKAMFLIAFAVILMWLLENIFNVWLLAVKVFSIFTPFVLGLAIAFIFNSPMKVIERKLFQSKKIFKNLKPSLIRTISYILTLLLFVFTIFITLFIIIPELAATIQDLSVKLPSYWDNLLIFVNEKLENNPQIIQWINNIDFDWKKLGENALSFFKNSALNLVGSTFSIASSVVSGIVTFSLGFVFSIYVLLQKETLSRQVKKLIRAFLPEKIADRIFHIGALSNNVFSQFLHGQMLEGVIIGFLFFVSMSIFRFPYALTISVLIAVTSLVPMFGTLVGCIIGAFLIFVVNAKLSLWFIIMFLIIQQIEGNLIYPHVVGKAAGLPSIWILVAVTVGGNLMGILGILLFIPLVSVLYTLLREYVNCRLKAKNIGEV